MPTSLRADLGWDEFFERSWAAHGRIGAPGRVSRLDRGWSTVMRPAEGAQMDIVRVRNIGADVAVGDWILTDDDRVTEVLERKSAFTRRASFDGMRAESQTVAANVDIVCLVHSAGTPPNQRRLERELVLGFDSGARPVVVLTKADVVDDIAPLHTTLAEVALGVPVLIASGRTGEGVGAIADLAEGSGTLAFLGASGVGKSTLINSLLGQHVQETSNVRAGDQRGRHTTVATELLPLPGGGWLIDTPGVRAVSLWLSGEGIERAFADVFELMDHCRFRDCKHDQEPGCAVRAAIRDGRLDPLRLVSLERLVAEEAALEEEQRARVRLDDKVGRRRPSGS
ncbi:MAG: ribosome small subunit-dependent GTPase A [Actinomycetota bacterium]|nr:ribosome small subunit-dependent GTPase A [Actinomycetota bacterium]